MNSFESLNSLDLLHFNVNMYLCYESQRVARYKTVHDSEFTLSLFLFLPFSHLFVLNYENENQVILK